MKVLENGYYHMPFMQREYIHILGCLRYDQHEYNEYEVEPPEGATSPWRLGLHDSQLCEVKSITKEEFEKGEN